MFHVVTLSGYPVVCGPCTLRAYLARGYAHAFNGSLVECLERKALILR